MGFKASVTGILTAAVVLLTSARAVGADVGAQASGYWDSSATWTSAAVPGEGDFVYIGSNVPAGAAQEATVALTQDQAASRVYLGYSYLNKGVLQLGDSRLSIGDLLYLGYTAGAVGAIERGGGSFTTRSVFVDHGQSLVFGAGDRSETLVLSNGATATTAATGNVTWDATLSTGATLALGADMEFGDQLQVPDASATIDMGGHAIRGGYVYLAPQLGAPTLLNRGPLVVRGLAVSNRRFDLSAADSVGDFYLCQATTVLDSTVSLLEMHESTATTTEAGSVTGRVTVSLGSTLTLGADMTLSGKLDVFDPGSTLDMGGHAIRASEISINTGGSPNTLLNRGPLTAGQLYVANCAFDLTPADSITDFRLYNGTSDIGTRLSSLFLDAGSTATMHGMLSKLTLSRNSTATTTPTENVTGDVVLILGSSLALGADLTLTGSLEVYSGSVVDAQNHSITTESIYFGFHYSTPATLINNGPIHTNQLYLGHGSVMTLHPGDHIGSTIGLHQASVLTVLQADGQSSGLTLDGPWLDLHDNSVVQLTAGHNSRPSWVFRWRDHPTMGDWERGLADMISGGGIVVTAPDGYSIFHQGDYTYIASPGSLEWNGGANGDNRWSNADNWGGATAVAGKWLKFGALTPEGHAENYNDVTDSPEFYGIWFSSDAPQYDLTGNPIRLAGSVLNQSASDQTISLDLQLAPNGGAFEVGVFDTAPHDITVAGTISGEGMALTKTGSGRLVLTKANTYTGGTIVSQGILEVTDVNALPAGHTLTIGASGTVALASGVSAKMAANEAVAVPEPSTLALLGIGAVGLLAYAWRRRKSGGVAERTRIPERLGAQNLKGGMR